MLKLFRGCCVTDMKLILESENEADLRAKIGEILDAESFKSYYWCWNPAAPMIENRATNLWEIDYGSHHDFFYFEVPPEWHLG
jgi:hypothetical protein